MPEAPEQFKTTKLQTGDGIERHRSGEAGQQRGGNGLYQKYHYIKFRERMKQQQRREDLDRVHDIYESLEGSSFKDYINWLENDNPLCKQCLEEGLIKPGRVLDHIIPIEQGGSIYDRDNHQFLCDPHHNRKRGKEDKA